MHSCDSQTSLRQNPARVPAFLLPGLPGIVVAFCLVLAGCNDTPHKAETDEPLPVAAVKPERRNVPLLVESTGMTQAVRTADIVARVEGTLQKIAYEDGALVQEGDTLFVIDPTMYKAKRQQAEATLAAQKAVRNRAAVEYARNQKLYAGTGGLTVHGGQLARTVEQCRSAGRRRASRPDPSGHRIGIYGHQGPVHRARVAP